MNPHKIKCTAKGFEEKQKQEDYMNWLNGKYFISALETVVSACLSKNSNVQYFEEPLFSLAEKEKHKNDLLPEKERVEQTKSFFAMLQIMQANFEREHPKEVQDEDCD